MSKDMEIQKLSEDLISILKEKKLTLSTAESCTGGLISKYITDISGSSDSFLGGVITYSNESKTNLLNVSHDILNNFGAVSPECAKHMAHGCQELFHTDISVSITGIAGPTGGTDEKPVGTVNFHYLIKNLDYHAEKVFEGDRNEVRQEAAFEVIHFLINELKTIKVPPVY